LNSSVLKALQSVETTYGVKITDDNVNDELAQEKQIYPDNSGIDSSALSELKKLLSDLYSKFPNAPEDSNSNCDGVKGCVSGYRGYSTQVKTFGSKISRDGGVSNRQKFSALPGFSQHHTGKGFDILSVEPSWWNKNSDIKSWVANNVCKYGFKVSYPTQGVLRSAEPWHLFYTGQFCGGDKEEKTPETTKTVEKEKTPETIKTESGDLISDITNFSKSSRTLTNLKKEGGRLSFNLEAQNLQKALQFLKYSLPKWGTDGKFGNETESALMKFESSNGLEEDGKFDSEDAEVLVKKLISSGYKKTDNQQIQVTPTEVEKDKVVATTTNDDEYVVLTPENYQGKNVHVLFGGSHTSGYSKNSFKTEAIQKYGNILKPYATNTIIVVTHHMNTVSNVQKYVSEKYGANVTSLAGFSQGGKEAWRHASDGSFKLVGLIDPSTYQTDVQFGSGTYLYCDPKNWGTTGFYGETRRKLEWYCENKEKYSGRVTCFNKGGWHMNFGILKSFYDTYGSMI
jgi:peptidoglycan hydrolase-like protein with peptidoglycan-binding domain